MAKIKFEDVRDSVAFHGWTLLSKEYVNLNTEMEFSCPEGHIVYTSWKKLRENFNCPSCVEAEKIYTTTEIKPKSKGVNRVLALDQATNTSGWCIFDDKELVAYGKINFTQSDAIERMAKIRNWLLNIIEVWKPDRIALEDIQLQKFTGKNGATEGAVTTYKVLAQLQGVLAVTCFEKNITHSIVHTATWRSHCKISAKSRADQKRAAQLYVQKKYEKNVTQDEADAICIGTYMVEKHLKNNEMIRFV